MFIYKRKVSIYVRLSIGVIRLKIEDAARRTTCVFVAKLAILMQPRRSGYG